jgi:AcrR family transcriptional regulator
MPPKFTRRADARPDELARAALELCAEQGVQATRVADVAERAGVTVGTIYRYFASKDELVDAALALARPPVRAHELADRPGAALPALAEAARRWGGFFDGDGARAVRVTLSEPRRRAPRGATYAPTSTPMPWRARSSVRSRSAPRSTNRPTAP